MFIYILIPFYLTRYTQSVIIDIDSCKYRYTNIIENRHIHTGSLTIHQHKHWYTQNRRSQTQKHRYINRHNHCFLKIQYMNTYKPNKYNINAHTDKQAYTITLTDIESRQYGRTDTFL